MLVMLHCSGYSGTTDVMREGRLKLEALEEAVLYQQVYLLCWQQVTQSFLKLFFVGWFLLLVPRVGGASRTLLL